MGRSTKSRKKNKNKPSQSRQKVVGEPSGKNESNGLKYSIKQLLEKAREAIDTFDYEIAQKFCQRALEMDSDNIKALEMSGQLLLDLGNIEAAKHCFGRAVELKPEEGHSKYMYLGQLFHGAEAISCFQKGIELMMKLREAEVETATLGASNQTCIVSQRDVSNAYCSVAELYMTDCCDNEGAEGHCRENIEKAITVDVTNPEALQLYASFLLVKQDIEAARERINESVALWLPRARQLDADKPTDTEAENVEDDFDQLNPVKLGYQTRIQTVQILVEVKEFDTACEILEGLLDEDDEVVEVWHLLGWVHYQQGEDYYNNARHYLNKASEILIKTGDDDKEMKSHIDELLNTLGPGPSEDPDETIAGDQDPDVDDEADSSDDDAMEQS